MSSKDNLIQMNSQKLSTISELISAVGEPILQKSKRIELRDNLLAEIAIDPIEDWVLERLDLSSNIIQICKLRLHKLISLDLSHNILKSVPILKDLKELRELNLSHNKITSVSPEMFICCPKLRILSLNSNKIMFESPKHFINFIETLKMNLKIHTFALKDNTFINNDNYNENYSLFIINSMVDLKTFNFDTSVEKVIKDAHVAETARESLTDESKLRNTSKYSLVKIYKELYEIEESGCDDAAEAIKKIIVNSRDFFSNAKESKVFREDPKIMDELISVAKAMMENEVSPILIVDLVSPFLTIGNGIFANSLVNFYRHIVANFSEQLQRQNQNVFIRLEDKILKEIQGFNLFDSPLITDSLAEMLTPEFPKLISFLFSQIKIYCEKIKDATLNTKLLLPGIKLEKKNKEKVEQNRVLIRLLVQLIKKKNRDHISGLLTEGAKECLLKLFSDILSMEFEDLTEILSELYVNILSVLEKIIKIQEIAFIKEIYSRIRNKDKLKQKVLNLLETQFYFSNNFDKQNCAQTRETVNICVKVIFFINCSDIINQENSTKITDNINNFFSFISLSEQDGMDGFDPLLIDYLFETVVFLVDSDFDKGKLNSIFRNKLVPNLMTILDILRENSKPRQFVCYKAKYYLKAERSTEYKPIEYIDNEIVNKLIVDILKFLAMIEGKEGEVFDEINIRVANSGVMQGYIDCFQIPVVRKYCLRNLEQVSMDQFEDKYLIQLMELLVEFEIGAANSEFTSVVKSLLILVYRKAFQLVKGKNTKFISESKFSVDKIYQQLVKFTLIKVNNLRAGLLYLIYLLSAELETRELLLTSNSADFIWKILKLSHAEAERPLPFSEIEFTYAGNSLSIFTDNRILKKIESHSFFGLRLLTKIQHELLGNKTIIPGSIDITLDSMTEELISLDRKRIEFLREDLKTEFETEDYEFREKEFEELKAEISNFVLSFPKILLWICDNPILRQTKYDNEIETKYEIGLKKIKNDSEYNNKSFISGTVLEKLEAEMQTTPYIIQDKGESTYHIVGDFVSRDRSYEDLVNHCNEGHNNLDLRCLLGSAILNIICSMFLNRQKTLKKLQNALLNPQVYTLFIRYIDSTAFSASNIAPKFFYILTKIFSRMHETVDMREQSYKTIAPIKHIVFKYCTRFKKNDSILACKYLAKFICNMAENFYDSHKFILLHFLTKDILEYFLSNLNKFFVRTKTYSLEDYTPIESDFIKYICRVFVIYTGEDEDNAFEIIERLNSQLVNKSGNMNETFVERFVNLWGLHRKFADKKTEILVVNAVFFGNKRVCVAVKLQLDCIELIDRYSDSTFKKIECSKISMVFFVMSDLSVLVESEDESFVLVFLEYSTASLFVRILKRSYAALLVCAKLDSEMQEPRSMVEHSVRNDYTMNNTTKIYNERIIQVISMESVCCVKTKKEVPIGECLILLHYAWNDYDMNNVKQYRLLKIKKEGFSLLSLDLYENIEFESYFKAVSELWEEEEESVTYDEIDKVEIKSSIRLVTEDKKVFFFRFFDNLAFGILINEIKSNFKKEKNSYEPKKAKAVDEKSENKRGQSENKGGESKGDVSEMSRMHFGEDPDRSGQFGQEDI